MNKLTSSILYSLFVENSGKNWVFSPASYLEAMGNLSVCIKNKNLTELQKVASDIGGKHADGLEVYNCLLHAKEYAPHIEKDIAEILAERGADFRSFEGIEVIDLVNRIVSEKTNGKITNLLAPSDYNEFLKFVLLNCVYFKKEWQNEFDKPHLPGSFDGASRIATVKYLKKQSWLRFYEDSYMDIAELPYKDSEICCYVIVPKISLFDVFSKLKENLSKISKVKSGIEVNLWVPPFKTESAHDLEEPTKMAGVQNIWNWNQDWTLVDLDKLAAPDPSYMKVSFIKQKAYIDFTQKGTEAAAATAIGMLCASGACFSQPPPVKYIHATKPFIYVLANKHTPDNLLFVGVINDVPDSIS